MTQVARRFQHEETISTIKEKLDVSTLNNFLITTPDKAVSCINYWEKKMLNATPEQKQSYSLEIAKLEALLITMTDLSLDVYNVQAEAMVDSSFKEDTSIKEVIKTTDTKEKKVETKEAKVVQMELPLSDKPKLSELARKAKEILKTKNFESAEELVKKYLSTGNYVPKREGQIAEQWSDSKIQNWLKDLKSNIAEEKKEPTTNITNGLTLKEAELNDMLESAIPYVLQEGGFTDPESIRKRLKRWIYRDVNDEEELEILKTFAKRIFELHNDPKVPANDLSKALDALYKFIPIFFGKTRATAYTAENVAKWVDAVKKNVDVDHYGILKAVKKEEKKVESKVETKTTETKKSDDSTVVSINDVNKKMASLIDKPFDEIKVLFKDLVNKTINSPYTQKDKTKDFVLKFGKEETLYEWLNRMYNALKMNTRVVEKHGLEVKETKTEKANEKPVAEKSSKEVDGTPLLNACESAYKKGVSVEQFVKDNLSTVKNADGTFKPLSFKVTSNVNKLLIFVTEDDFKKWVQEVYQIQDKAKERQSDTKEKKEEELPSLKTFNESAKKLLNSKITKEAFYEWAYAELLNKRHKEQKENRFFKTKEAVNAYVNNLFKNDIEKLSATPSSEKKESTATIEDAKQKVIEFSKEENSTMATVTKKVREFFLNNNILINDQVPTLKGIFEFVQQVMEENKDVEAIKNILDNHKSVKAATETKKVEEPVTEEKTETVAKDEKVESNMILERVDLKKAIPELYEKIKTFKSLSEVYNTAVELKEAGRMNEALSMCLEFLPNIEESKSWTSEMITDWFKKNFIDEVKKESESETEDTDDSNETSEETNIDTLKERVGSSTNKRTFKQSISEILRRAEDKAKAKEEIISIIKNGSGNHTRKIAKMPDGEITKMLDNIERKADKSA